MTHVDYELENAAGNVALHIDAGRSVLKLPSARRVYGASCNVFISGKLTFVEKPRALSGMSGREQTDKNR